MIKSHLYYQSFIIKGLVFMASEELSQEQLSEWVREQYQSKQNGLFCTKMTKMTQMAWFSKIAIFGAIQAAPFALGGP